MVKHEESSPLLGLRQHRTVYLVLQALIKCYSWSKYYSLNISGLSNGVVLTKLNQTKLNLSDHFRRMIRPEVEKLERTELAKTPCWIASSQLCDHLCCSLGIELWARFQCELLFFGQRRLFNGSLDLQLNH